MPPMVPPKKSRAASDASDMAIARSRISRSCGGLGGALSHGNAPFHDHFIMISSCFVHILIQFIDVFSCFLMAFPLCDLEFRSRRRMSELEVRALRAGGHAAGRASPRVQFDFLRFLVVS